MDFVDRRCLQTPYEAHRILLGESPELGVVQRDVCAAVIIGNSAGKRGLARLAWPHHGDDPGVCERQAHRFFGVAPYKSYFRV